MSRFLQLFNLPGTKVGMAFANKPTYSTPVYENGYVDGLVPVKYYKDQLGIVHLYGEATSGTVSTSIRMFTLPVGFRPTVNTQVRFHAPLAVALSPADSDKSVILQITNTGMVRIAGPGTMAVGDSVILNGISFYAGW